MNCRKSRQDVTENHGVGSSILPLGTNTLNNLGELTSVMRC